jgi:hypothetical protein
MLQLGYSQAIITPSFEHPVFLAGFGQNRRAETVHDDLTVRVMALKDDHTTLILVALDLIGFFSPDVLEVSRRIHTKAPEVQVILASTHTHHAPDTMGLWGPDARHSGVNQGYMSSLKEQIISTVLSSLENTQAVNLKTACVHVPGVAKNARDPEIVDDELTTAQFCQAQTTQPVVSLFNFPCHPEVLWEHNPHITADYPGVLRRKVEESTGAPCIFFSGALGGMMTPNVVEHSFEEAEQMGTSLAHIGLEALRGSKTADVSPTISLKKVEITPKLTNILFKLAFRRKLLPDVRNRNGQVSTEVNLLKIGPLWLASVPGELLPKLGIVLKESMRRAGAGAAGVIGLANNELGYILPKEDFRYPLNPFMPGRHYEETMSVGREIGPLVMEAIQSQLIEGSSSTEKVSEMPFRKLLGLNDLQVAYFP